MLKTVPSAWRFWIRQSPLASLLLLLPQTATSEPAKIPTQQALAEILKPIRKKHDVPALAAAIVNRQGLVAVAAVGVRKRGDTTPATSNDQFHLGSDTKAMTATLLALFAEKGVLKWDETLGQRFPDLAPMMTPEVRKITVEQLLTHRAGLPPTLRDGWEKIPRDLSPRQQRQEVLKRIAADKLDSEPGLKFEYSNLGYVLAGHVAEEAGNADWEELLTRKLFEPLGMKSGGFGPMGTPEKIDQPWPHGRLGRPLSPTPNRDNPPVMGPAGRVHCSLPDWAKFVALHLRAGKGQPALLKPETFRKLHSVSVKDSDYTLGGWGLVKNHPRAKGTVLAHDGSNTMNHATAWLALEHGFAVLVATNQGGDEAKKACVEARRRLIQDYLP